jgi:hypothetical protein
MSGRSVPRVAPFARILALLGVVVLTRPLSSCGSNEERPTSVPVEIVLSADGAVRGVARDEDGQPSPDVVVFLAQGREIRRETTSRADGSFEFRGVSPATYSLGRRVTWITHDVHTSVLLSEGAMLRIEVLDSAGSAVAATILEILDESGERVPREAGESFPAAERGG